MITQPFPTPLTQFGGGPIRVGGSQPGSNPQPKLGNREGLQNFWRIATNNPPSRAEFENYLARVSHGVVQDGGVRTYASDSTALYAPLDASRLVVHE